MTTTRTVTIQPAWSDKPITWTLGPDDLSPEQGAGEDELLGCRYETELEKLKAQPTAEGLENALDCYSDSLRAFIYTGDHELGSDELAYGYVHGLVFAALAVGLHDAEGALRLLTEREERKRTFQ
jgi:hypothetical protein